MQNNLEGVFLRLGYALREAKHIGNSTIILGAGCSLSSTKKDISTWGIMKQCLLEHGIDNIDNIGWEELYQKFINIVWQGKAPKEQEHLLKSKLNRLTPTEGHLCLRSLIEHGYIHNVITTNFDMLLEETFKGLSYQKRVGDGEYHIIGNAPSFNLLKIHGDLEEGKFRFAPHELVQLPMPLQKDIAEKTAGPLIFIGYRGQDVGLMNSLSTKNEYAVYWIDISQFDHLDMYMTQSIQNFMTNRSSAGNYLYGKEFGDFNEIVKKLNDLLIRPSYNTIIKSKEFRLSDIWKSTSIVEMLRIYSRIYELFLDILEISASIQKKLSWNLDNPAYTKDYDEHLYSYLYFFNSKNLPSNLIHIPNNELDALVLGVSIEILVRTTGNAILPKEFISEIEAEFNNKYSQNIVNNVFWLAVEKIVCSEFDFQNVIDFNMPNKLVLKTYDVPLKEFNELLRVISFLALLLPINIDDNRRIDSKYKARQLLNGKYDRINIIQNIINIDLGIIKSEYIDVLYNFYLKALPDIHILKDTSTVDEKKYVVFKSKWIHINLEIDEDGENEQFNHIYFYKILERQSKTSQLHFIRQGSIYKQDKDNHIKLQFDRDILIFLTSNKVAMFVIGPSGCGKTSALQNFIRNKADNIIPIIVSPRNTTINKQGLSLFFDFDITNESEDMVLGYIDQFMKIREQQLILIFDGLNEVSDNARVQQLHYSKVLELSDKIYHNHYTAIKLIITCREQVYYEYKSATSLSLNPLYFYTNRTIIKNDDASYIIPKLSNRDKKCLLDEYISIDTLKQLELLYNSEFLNINSILNDNVTPLFIAIAAESLNNYKGIEIIKRSGTIYDLFANSMMDRLELADAFLAKKIIYAYFDLVIAFRNTSIQVTKFKLLNKLEVEYHSCVNNAINKLIDVNILIKDYINPDTIKFQHDKIEEFFLRQYIEEYEYKGLPFFDSVFSMCSKNVIYQEGIIQYFLGLEKRGKLKELKELINILFIDYINIIPQVLMKVLSYSKDLKHLLIFLINPDDSEGSKKILSIIIWGLDQSLRDYSVITYDIEKIIEALQTMPDNTIISNEIQAYMSFFKSKLQYYFNHYERALNYIKEARILLEKGNHSLLAKIDIHHSVILIEQGYSKQCIDYLEKDFEAYQNSNDLKTMVDLGIELGRALNHSGQTTRTLELYNILLSHENEIDDLYALARIYEQKANVLNKLMYHKLQYGFIDKKDLSENVINDIRELFSEALFLYDQSIKLLLKTNAIFTYSGVLPEKINTFISYSFSIEPIGLDECRQKIEELDVVFSTITTPFETDFNLSKAYYYEYLNRIDIAESCINKALDNAIKLKIKNKEAKCRCFYSQFSYRRIKNQHKDVQRWYNIGILQLDMAIDYYQKNTLTKNNITLEDCYLLRELFQNI